MMRRPTDVAGLRIRRHAVVFAVASIALFAVLMLLIWGMLGFEFPAIGAHGWVALVVGSALSVALSVGLMGATFASDDSGIDAAASGRAPTLADIREGRGTSRPGE